MRMAAANKGVFEKRHLLEMRLYDVISRAIASFQPPRPIFAPLRGGMRKWQRFLTIQESSNERVSYSRQRRGLGPVEAFVLDSHLFPDHQTGL
jgi:hypothetical protein